MAKLINKERSVITLPTGHQIGKLATLETTNDVIRQIDNWPMLSGRIGAGQIEVVFDPDPVLDDQPATVVPPLFAPIEPTSETSPALLLTTPEATEPETPKAVNTTAVKP